jgi:hypothetical protein
LEAKTAKELFHSMAVSVFRFSAAQVRWKQKELEKIHSLWVQAYERAEHLAAGTASDIFVFAEDWGGKEHSTPANIIAQELFNNIRRCLVHDDVAKSITMQELQRAKDERMCSTLDELYDEMELWDWNTVQHNRWARAAKACNQVKVRPMWPVEEQEEDTKKLSWAAATRSLRRLKARIVSVEGKREYPQERAWMLDDAAQWELLFRGHKTLWRSAGALRAAGYDSVLSLRHDIVNDNRPVPMLTREPAESRGTQHIRLLIPRGIQGLSENDRV